MHFSAFTSYCQLVDQLPDGPYLQAQSLFHPLPDSNQILVTETGFLALCRQFRAHGIDPVRWRGSYRELLRELAVTSAAQSLTELQAEVKEASLSNLFMARQLETEGAALLAELKRLTIEP